jgi:PAS domain S-box-containing protein
MGGAILGSSAHAQLLFERVFENSPDAILITDSDGRIIRGNPQVERIFGYRPDELIGQLIEALIPDRFRQIHPSHRSGYNTQPQQRPMGMGLELFGKRKDGNEFPVDIMLSPLRVDGTPFALSVIRDVTRRKQAEQERDRQASVVREQAALLELAHDSVIVRDLENHITFWNRGAERSTAGSEKKHWDS